MHAGGDDKQRIQFAPPYVYNCAWFEKSYYIKAGNGMELDFRPI